jgi:hypothetical protein
MVLRWPDSRTPPAQNRNRRRNSGTGSSEASNRNTLLGTILTAMRRSILLVATLLLQAQMRTAHDVPVPSSCTPDANSKLAALLASGTTSNTDNVMICGITTRRSRYQPAGAHGSHHVHSVLVRFPDGSNELIEVVTNDRLDGVVTSPAHAQIFAYGQAFFSNTHQFAAGIHDTHCSTHPGADNGWVVVNGEKHPESCPNRSW